MTKKLMTRRVLKWLEKNKMDNGDVNGSANKNYKKTVPGPLAQILCSFYWLKDKKEHSSFSNAAGFLETEWTVPVAISDVFHTKQITLEHQAEVTNDFVRIDLVDKKTIFQRGGPALFNLFLHSKDVPITYYLRGWAFWIPKTDHTDIRSLSLEMSLNKI